MNINNILHAISNVSYKSKSFTTKQQINPQELKHTKTKRKASNARSKHLTHDDIPLLKSESHEHSSSNTGQRLSMSSWRRLDAVGHSSRKTCDHLDRWVVNDCAFPRGCPESPDKWRPKSRLSQRNDCYVITRQYRYLCTSESIVFQSFCSTNNI